MQVDLYLQRLSDNGDDTIGFLTFNNELLCFTLEDEFRDKKVKGDTRIPEGVYEIKFRNIGGFDNRYSKKFGNMHKGMLQLQNVENFEYILIHCGNTDKDTAGCILVGNKVNNNRTEKGFLSESVKAYKRIYPIIADLLTNGIKVYLHVLDEHHLLEIH